MNRPATQAEHAHIQRILEQHQGEAGALLPVLHDIQDALGHVPEHALAVIAKALNLSRADVYGVVTYYHHFRLSPPAKHVVQICRAEACQARGAEALLAHAQSHPGCQAHGANHNNGITIEPVYCLGQCAIGPNVLVDDKQLHGRVSVPKFDALIQTLKAK